MCLPLPLCICCKFWEMLWMPFFSILVFSPSPNIAISCGTHINTQAPLVCPLFEKNGWSKILQLTEDRDWTPAAFSTDFLHDHKPVALGTSRFTQSYERGMMRLFHFDDSHVMNPPGAGTQKTGIMWQCLQATSFPVLGVHTSSCTE